jgi:hypothetical protein
LNRVPDEQTAQQSYSKPDQSQNEAFIQERSAPNAIRNPISRVRCATENAMTP